MSPNHLSRALGRLLTPAKPRIPGPSRAGQGEAKRLAAEHGVTIEKLGGGFSGWDVLPPKWLPASLDPGEGDHYCQDWPEILDAVKAYAALAHLRPKALDR